MSSYRYRKIWEKANGPIPKDEQGRSYEIHHIDGDNTNNNPSNLICISIEDHYKLHLEQGDYYAANLIATRFDRSYTKGFKGKSHSKETIEKIKASKAANPYKHSEEALAKIKESKKNLDFSHLKGRKLTRESIEKREMTRKANGNRKVLVCPHCKTEGINFMEKWHFDNCKYKN